MTRIQNYFNLLAKRIAIGGEIACCSSSHRADIGENREQLARIFLEKHLPKRLSVSLGGQIVGCDGSESNQIDIIVSSDIAVRFEENKRTFVTTEGVAAAITVKSYLNKSALKDCLLNIASIPQVDWKVLSFYMVGKGNINKFVNSHPSFYVISYKGIKLQRCVDYVRKFYQEHKDIPVNRYPRGIIVLEKEYYVGYCWIDRKTLKGATVPAGTFFPMQLEKDMLGYPLTDMLVNISTYTSWLPHLHINIDRYFKYAYGFPND